MKLGLMQPAGPNAFNERRAGMTGIYSYEQDAVNFSKEYEKKFKSNKSAWDFFNEQAASYRKTGSHRVMRAKKEETQMKRLDELIKNRQNGRGSRGSHTSCGGGKSQERKIRTRMDKLHRSGKFAAKPLAVFAALMLS